VGGAKKIFDGVSAERQSRIATAVFRGEALTDPEDARLAVAFARTFGGRSSSRWRWLHRLTAVAAFGYLAVEFVLGLHRRARYDLPDTATILLFMYLLAHMFAGIWGRQVRKRVDRAERLNLEVAGLADLSVSELSPPQKKWDAKVQAPRRKRQWKPHVLGGVAVLFLVALGAWSEALVVLLLAVILGVSAAKAIEVYPTLAVVERIVLWWWVGSYTLLVLSFVWRTPAFAVATAVSLAGLGLFVLLNVDEVADRLAMRETGLWVFRVRSSARTWRLSAAVTTLFAIAWALDPSQHP
jgi:hypothetical protein